MHLLGEKRRGRKQRNEGRRKRMGRKRKGRFNNFVFPWARLGRIVLADELLTLVAC